MLKANEKRALAFETEVKSGDEIEVTLGYIIVNEKAAKSLGLDKEKEPTKFTVLKSTYFTVK